MDKCILVLLASFAFTGDFFILPTFYCHNKNSEKCESTIKFYVNKLYSSKEFVNLDYSYSGFCPYDKDKWLSSNIGQKISGDSLYLSQYQFPFGENIPCKQVCTMDYKRKQLDDIKFAIDNYYQQEWLVDDLPVLQCSMTDGKRFCSTHFFIGCFNSDNTSLPKCDINMDPELKNKYVLFNHLNFDIIYTTLDHERHAEIIEVIVYPSSQKNCHGDTDYIVFDKNTKSLSVNFTYSINFLRNDSLRYENRFDYIYNLSESSRVKWFSITISILILIILTSISAHFFIRAVRSDISRYTELINTGFDAQDEFGWKLLKGDIFRAPKFRLLLSITVGNGIQIVCMTLFTLLVAFLGFFSVLARGSAITCLIVSFVLLGALGGFVSARIYKFFDGENWKLCVLGSALLHSGIIFTSLAVINILISMVSPGSSISFITLFEMFALWAFVSIPLSFAGAFYGFKRRAIKCPVKKNIVPRMIPRQTMYTKPSFAIIFGSFLCFVCIYVKFCLIFQSIWLRHSYVMFGLLFFTVILLVIICAEVSTVFCYFHLCDEDYRWQWRSFFTVACSALYCLISYIFEFLSSNQMSSLGKFVSLCYTTVMLYMLALATGSVGFIACFYVLLKMFSSIKVD